MPIDRKLWCMEISEKRVPDWPCPNCGASSLAIVENSFKVVYDGSTTRWQSSEDFEPEAATGLFIGILYCTKKTCGETCAISGRYTTTLDPDEYGYRTYASGLPKSITPPPPMIPIPDECSEPIRQEVESAFALYWCDYSASLNHIRRAIELLLTDVGLPRTTINKQKKRVPLTLHSRIENLKTKKPQLATVCDRMMAVKHLGNAGSHPGDVVRDDVFDGLDILERVLHDTYSDHDSVLAKMVAQINKRKGPRKRKR